MTGRFACLRVQPSHGRAEGKVEHPVVWLLVEWPPEAEKPTKFWLSNLDADTTLPELVRLAKIRWSVEQNYQQMKEELGLDLYEVRSSRGWHHQVTLTMIAFCFLVAESLLHKKLLGLGGTPNRGRYPECVKRYSGCWQHGLAGVRSQTGMAVYSN